MPEAMAKRPRMTKNVVRKLAMSVASSTMSCFVSSDWNFAVPMTPLSASLTLFE